MASGPTPPHDTPSPPDAYERGYMRAAGEVVHREKQRAKWHWIVLGAALATAAMAVGFALALPAPAAAAIPAICSAIVGFAWATATVQRIVVTTAELVVSGGLRGSRVALTDVERIEIVPYEFANYGGWGPARPGVDGTLGYVLGGGSGMLVRITYREDGQTKRIALSSESPTALADALERACAAHGTYRGHPVTVERTQLRIADPPGGEPSAVEADAEAEAGAVEHASARTER